MRDSIRSFLVFMTLAVGGLMQTTPAAAWNAHLAAHVGNSVALDEEHSHDVQSQASDHEPGPIVPDQDGGGAKHDHMASASACFSASLHDGPELAPPPVSAAPRVQPPSAALREVRPPPLSRPPRSV